MCSIASISHVAGGAGAAVDEKDVFDILMGESYLGGCKDLEVKIEHDTDTKTTATTDTDIGTSKADLLINLGIVAKSSTTNFMEAMAEGAGTNLIG